MFCLSRQSSQTRGFTLIEAIISVALVGVAVAVSMQILLSTAQNMDIEMNNSDMALRTSGRLYDLNSDLECASAADVRVFNSGGLGFCSNPPIVSGASIPVQLPVAPSIFNDGATLGASTGTSTGTATGAVQNLIIGDMIAFHIFTYNNGQKAFGPVVCYYWTPLRRGGGPPDPALGMLVKEVWPDPNHDWWGNINKPGAGLSPLSTQVLEENLLPCNFTMYPNAPDANLGSTYPTGFAVFKGDLEPNAGVGAGLYVTERARMVTVSLQRAQNVNSNKRLNNLSGTLTSTAVTTSSALSQSVQTFYLKTP